MRGGEKKRMAEKLKRQSITFTLMKPMLIKEKGAEFKYVIVGKITIPLDFLTDCIVEDHKEYYWLKAYDETKKCTGGWYIKEDPRPYMQEQSIPAYMGKK